MTMPGSLRSPSRHDAVTVSLSYLCVTTRTPPPPIVIANHRIALVRTTPATIHYVQHLYSTTATLLGRRALSSRCLLWVLWVLCAFRQSSGLPAVCSPDLCAVCGLCGVSPRALAGLWLVSLAAASVWCPRRLFGRDSNERCRSLESTITLSMSDLATRLLFRRL